MLLIAIVGLFVNLAAARVMSRSRGKSLNLEAAFRHVIADLLGSIGVIVAALVILLTGWLYTDPLVSVLIGLLILGSAWTILRDSTQILLEATPRDVDAREIASSLAAVDGVVDVHDLQESASRTSRRSRARSSAAHNTRPSAVGIAKPRMRRWSSCSATWRRTGSRTTSSPGAGGDFMRSIAQEVFGIPPERVIGSTSALEYTSDDKGGTITHKAALAFLDDGPQKPIQIWARVGRRPLLAGGNSNGDLPMLDFARHQDRPSLRLLVLHDDAEREFAYTSGAEQAMKRANTSGWTVVSMKDDFATVFASP
jgi:hypothetical protein